MRLRRYPPWPWLLCAGHLSGAALGASPEASVALLTRPEAERVTLEALLAYAAQHAPSMRSVRARAHSLDGEARAAGALFAEDPTLSVAAGPRSQAGAEGDYDAVVAVRQPFEPWGQRGLRQNAVQEGQMRLVAEAAEAEAELRRDVRIAYGQAMLADQHLAVEEQWCALGEEVAAAARRRLVAGDAAAIEVHLAELAVVQARHEQLSARHAVQVARWQLAELVGWAEPDPPEPAPMQLEPPEAANIPSLGAMVDVALRGSAALSVRGARVREARAREKLAARSAWPSTALGVQLAREGAAGSPANTIVLGMLELGLPAWQGGQVERQRARVELREREAEAERIRLQVQAQVAQARSAFALGVQQLSLLRTELGPMLAETLTLLHRGVQAGELSLGVLRQAREQVLSTETQAQQAYGNYYRALAEIEWLLGESGWRQLWSERGEVPPGENAP